MHLLSPEFLWEDKSIYWRFCSFKLFSGEREWGWWRGDREWMDLVFYCQLNTTHGHDTGPRSLVTEWSPPVTPLSLHTSLFNIPLLWEKLCSHTVSLSNMIGVWPRHSVLITVRDVWECERSEPNWELLVDDECKVGALLTLPPPHHWSQEQPTQSYISPVSPATCTIVTPLISTLICRHHQTVSPHCRRGHLYLPW